MEKVISILGEQWTIKKVKEESDVKLGKADGYCDASIRTIVLADILRTEQTLADLSVYEAKVLRHEIIHAVLMESGLNECSDWARNEEMVDWFARQLPKINRAILDAMDIGKEDEIEERRRVA